MKIKFKERLGGSVSTRHGKTLLRSLPLMAAGLMLCSSSLRAADSPGVKFNPGVRYSQWAINSRATSFNANTTQCGMATISNGKVRKESFGKTGLDYVPGLVAKSMIEAADYYQSFDWATPWFLSVKEYGDKYYNSVATAGGSLDDLNAVKLYFGLYNNSNASSSDKSNYKTAIGKAQTGLVAHNTKYSIKSGTLAGNDVVGGWFHKEDYNNQMWLDGAYMGSALLAQLVNFNGTSSNIFGSTTADWDMVFKQMNIVWNMCWNSTDKLMYHGFEANAGTGTSNSNANTWKGLSGTKPYVFHSAAYWGRANAWYLMALVDVLEAMNNAGQSNTDNYKTLKQHLADLAAGIAARQDATTHGWYQVMDKDASYTASSYNSNWDGKPESVTNYIETSATAIFSAAYFKAVRLGLLSSTTQYDYKTIAKNAFEGIVNNYTYTLNDGSLEIWGSSRSAGIGGKGTDYKTGEKKFRDGSDEYYLLGFDVPMVKKDDKITEGKVLGGFIMAATEYERAYQNQDSKQILFAHDLAPEYDFSSAEGSLDATAYGNGTITYQWYKDNSAIADATSATYTPTESGTYKCTATANGTIITTSEAQVTVKTASSGEKEEETTTTTLFEYTVPTNTSITTTETSVGSYGSVSASANVTTDKTNGFKFDGNSKYLKITLSNNTLKEGDVITFTSYSTSSNAGIKASSTAVGTTVTLGSNSGNNEYNGSYTITKNDVLNGNNTLYLYRNSSSTTYLKAIKITRTGSDTPTTKQYSVTATAGEGGSVAIKNGSSETVVSGSNVDENTSLTFTATATDGYEFQNWTDGSNAEVSKENPYTTTVSAAINIKANFKKKETTGGEATTEPVTFPDTELKNLDSDPDPGSEQVSFLKTEAITITAGKGISANKDCLKVTSGSTAEFTISAANGAKITKITFTTNASGRSLTSDPEAKKTNSNKTWTYDFSSSKPSSIKFTNASTSNINVTGITVEYESSTPSTPKTDLTATYAAVSISATAGDGNLTAPELTVMAGETALTTEDYAVSYVSSATDVVKVEEDGTLTAAHKGTATITATITPADGTKYNATMATFTVNVAARQLKASFSPASVDANMGDEARELPTLNVVDVKTTQPVSDFTATYTSNDENVVKIENGKLVFTGVGRTTVTVTVTPTKPSVYESCTASFEVSVAKKTDPTKTTVVYDFLKDVGTEVAGVEQIKITEGSNIMFGTNFKPLESKYLTVGADGDGGFKAGDVITLKGYCLKKNSGILIYADPTDAEPQFQSPAFPDTEVTYTFTVQKDCDKLYFGRFGGSSTYVTSLNITRPATTGEKTRLTAAFAKNSDVIINKTDNYTIDLPALTVKAGNDELTADKYTVDYSSNDEDIATVADDGKITVKTTGTVTILATVTPADATKYEGCTATYTITVKDQTPLNISVNDVNINVTDANYKQPVIKVYGDDDKLLTLGTDYTLSYRVEGTNVSVENGLLKVAGEKYKWTEGTSTITVTATPTESLGETFKAGTMTFLYNVVKGKLTPAFLTSFTTTDEAIKIKKYDSKTNKNDKTFRVPLIYDGEDVSEYFNYTFKVTDAKGNEVTNKNNKKKGNEFTFRPDTEGEFTIAVSAQPTTDGDDYSDVYNTPAAISFKVDVKSTYIRPVITFNPETVQMYTGTTEGAPDVIVTDGTNELSGYSLKWISFTPSFVKVNETSGNLEAVNEGNGSVRVTVKGENLETMTAFLTVYVDDPAVYRAKDKDNNGVKVAYGNQKVMWNQDKTMSVTLGGWMFPNDVTEGLTYDSKEGLSKDYKWADTATLPKWKMSGFNRFVSGESSKNARQEDGSNALVNTTMISTADFKTKGEVKDRMFNVPCSGSYLVFNPATNGTVNVHIFQNGAFDSGKYRPQRRVFVMDEEGNFVKSTPEIENANGKPTGGLKALSNYKWDINPNGAETAPTIEQVRSHFKNIPADFDMTADKFQNNVLESDLSADIVPNAAYDETVEGSNGWCVLADSPVTYSFKVKAGKSYYLWNFGSKIGFYGFSFEEDATKPKVDEVTYDEAATNNQIVSTEAGHVAKVSINRHIKQGIWNACVLPFSLNKHQVDALFGVTYSLGNENGTQILYFDHVDANGKVWFVRHAYNTIVANKPFLIKPTNDVEVINTAACTDYPYVTIEAPDNNKPADWCSDGKYAWVSSYNNDMTLNEGDGYIGGKSGNFIQSDRSGVSVKGFRGYLKGLTPEAKTHALSTATSSNTEEGGSTTFIEGLTIDAEGNIVPVATDGKVYNINGQVVADGMKNMNTLPSGVYIINGKKYVK